MAALRVWDLAEARRVKERLDVNFIPAYFGPDNIDNVDLLPPISEVGVSVRVRRDDRDRALFAAKDVLSPHDTEEFPEFVGRCPKCHSEEIVFEGRGDLPPVAEAEDPDSAEGDAAFDSTEEEEIPDAELPASEADPNAKFNWRCDACGYKWQDDGIESDK